MTSSNLLCTSIDASMAAAWSEIVENLPEGLIVSARDPRDWRVLYLNTEATRMFGYARNEIENRSIHSLLPEFVDPSARTGDADEDGRTGRALLGRRRDGATFRVHVRHAAVPDAAVSAVILRLRDMGNSARPFAGNLAHDQSRDPVAEAERVAHALSGLRDSLRPLCCAGSAYPREPACIIKRMLATLNDDIRAVPSVARMAAPAPNGPPIKVLHIEDDASVRRAMGRVLRLKGCEVFSAATREQAMHYFQEDGWRPDLILADFQLADGATSESIVAEIAERLGTKPPTIVLTGATDRRAEVTIKSFADRVLTKPVEVRVLLDEFAVALERRA